MAPRNPEETRQRLCDAALELFAEHGFESTSIRMIAERAGVSLGLLYHYFPSKESLLQELFQQSLVLIQGCFTEAVAEADARERIRLAIRAAVRVIREQRQFYRVSLSVRHQPNVLGALSEGIVSMEAMLLAQWEGWLMEAAVPEAPVRAALLIASLDGLSQHFSLQPDTFPLEAAGELLIGDLFGPEGAAT